MPVFIWPPKQSPARSRPTFRSWWKNRASIPSAPAWAVAMAAASKSTPFPAKSASAPRSSSRSGRSLAQFDLRFRLTATLSSLATPRDLLLSLPPRSSSRRSLQRKLRRNVPHRQNRIHVDAHGIFHAPRVAARQRGCHWNAPSPRLFKDTPIPLLQSILSQRQSAQLIFAKWVSASHIKQKLRTKIVQRLLHGGH